MEIDQSFLGIRVLLNTKRSCVPLDSVDAGCGSILVVRTGRCHSATRRNCPSSNRVICKAYRNDKPEENSISVKLPATLQNLYQKSSDATSTIMGAVEELFTRLSTNKQRAVTRQGRPRQSDNGIATGELIANPKKSK